MRNPNGYGNIIKLSGNRRKPWAVRVSYRDKDNRIKTRYLSYHEKQAEAIDALDEYRRQKKDGTLPAPKQLAITLQDVYELWSTRKYARAGKSSIACYSAAWTRLCALGYRRIDTIGVDDLQAIIDKGEAMGLSQSSISNDHVLMKALFKTAMERDYIIKDYSAFVQLPHIDAKHEKGAFTDSQMNQLENMAQAGIPWADTVLMLCYTSFRITEFLTLTQLSYDAATDVLRGGMKTEAGKNRIVPVHPKIKDYLIQWLSQGGDAIICDGSGKELSSARYRCNAFATIMKQLEMSQATPHWCRHTFASRLHAVHAPELDIKRLMGHSNGGITDHYTHVDVEQLRTTINLLP